MPIAPPIFSIAKTKCFGKCPVFQCAVYKDGTIIYTGEKHVKYIGKHHGKLEQDNFKKLQALNEACNFPQLEENYLLNLPDKSKVILTYQNKKVTLHMRKATKELRNLIAYWDDCIKEMKLVQLEEAE
jgi:hypothetical protein